MIDGMHAYDVTFEKKEKGYPEERKTKVFAANVSEASAIVRDEYGSNIINLVITKIK